MSEMRRGIGFALALAACGGNGDNNNNNPDGGGNTERRLVFLHTNDEHSHVFAFGPEVDDFRMVANPQLVGGVARRHGPPAAAHGRDDRGARRPHRLGG